MTGTSIGKVVDKGNYLEETITIDNIPDLGDKNGEIFLLNLTGAIAECKKLITEGYRLTDFWADPDVGVQFILKKKK
ncbi:MAG: hypothetical protein C4589_11565 [Peptococcaceae bacterium]|nr:MAG: hypothetical protein C4589_11565 [Peptococcaceae bacterium]